MGMRTPINLFEMGVQPTAPGQLPAAQAAQAAQTPSQEPLPGETPAQYQARMAQGGAIPQGAVQVDNPLVAAVANLKGGGGAAPTGEAPAPDERPPVPPQPEQAAGGMVMPGGMVYTPPTTETMTQTTIKPGDPRALAMVGEVNAAQQQWTQAYQASQREMEKIDRDMAQDEILKQAMGAKQGELKQLLDSPDTFKATVDRVAKLRDQFDQAVTRSVQRVDPNKFWSDRDVGDRVTGGIALLLGGLAQGFGGGGGENPAWRIIDQAITRDIEAQKFNIAQAREEAAMFGDQINTELALQNWVDKKKVERLAMADALIVSSLSQYEARAKTVEQKRAAASALAEAQLRFADSKRAWMEMGFDQISTTVQSQQKAGKLGAPEGYEWTPWGYAPSKEGSKVISQAAVTHDEIGDLLRQMENHVNTVGTTAWSRDSKGKALALANRFVGLQSQIMQSGTLGESEYARYMENSPITLDYFDGLKDREQAIATLREMRRQNTTTAINMARSYIPQQFIRFPEHAGGLREAWKTATGRAVPSDYKRQQGGGK